MSKTSTDFAFHPAAEIYPLLSDSEIDVLAEDIRANGLRASIVVDCQNRIIDGRNRIRACRKAGVEPRFETFDGDDEAIVWLVISLNEHRRHLTPGQRAACGVIADGLLKDARKRAKERQSEGGRIGGKIAGRGRTKSNRVPDNCPEPLKGDSRDEVGDKHHVSGRAIDRAQRIKETCPETFGKVHNGEMTLNRATLHVKKEKKRAELKQKAKEADFLTEAPQWTLIHQDVFDGLQSVIDHHPKPRLIFADPPYNIGIDYGSGKKKDQLTPQEYVNWFEQWIRLCHDTLADDGSLWVMIGDEFAANYNLILKATGFTIRSWIKWYETFGVNCANSFNRTSRHIFWAVKDSSKFVFHAEPVTRQSDRQTKYNDKRAVETGKLWDDVWGINPPLPRLNQTCNERIPDFPTQLPIALVQAIVECASDPGDLVVDPFNGSGTTGVVCIRTKRKYIGIDISEKFIDLATLRLQGEKA